MPLTLSLSAMLSLTPYTVDSVLPAFPVAAVALGTTATGIQASITAYLAGIAAGQLVFGPLADRLGRRTPLLTGLSLSVVGAVLAALAPSLGMLLAARLAQGLGASAAMVLARVIVRDLTDGAGIVRALAAITAISSAANIAAPVLGGFLAAAVDWRAPLWLVAGLSAATLGCAATLVPETLPREARTRRGDPAPRFDAFRDPLFTRYVAVQACSSATMMAYVASSPFVYQRMLGFDAPAYGMLFALNAAVAVVVNVVVNLRFRGEGARGLAAVGFAVSLAGTATAAAALAAEAPRAVVAVAIGLSMSTLIMNGPNLVGLALSRVTAGVGAAAAALGFVQFTTGAVVSPIVGLGDPDAHVVPLVSMLVTAAAGLLLIVPRPLRRSSS